VMRRWEHLTGSGPVMNVRQHVEHLAMVRHSRIWLQATLDLLGQDLEIYPHRPWRRGRY
jgi:hypothetical protein